MFESNPYLYIKSLDDRDYNEFNLFRTHMDQLIAHDFYK